MNMLDAETIRMHRFSADLPELQHVRQFVGDLMTGHPSAADTVLAVSANAIEHSDSARSGGFAVQVAHLEDAMRIEVRDAGGPEQPKQGGNNPDATRGRGLFIVDSLSRDWGVARDMTHTSVWCEIACTHAPLVPERVAA
ncbi:ATP-binding protein [Nonomuraea sp. NPDC003707]